MAGELGRVVIEHSDPWVVGEHAAALREQRFAVRVCDGPAFRGGRCPVVIDGRCQLIDRADVVIHQLDAGDPGHAEVLGALRQCYPGTPVITDVAGDEPDTLVAAVTAAAAYLHQPDRPRRGTRRAFA